MFGIITVNNNKHVTSQANIQSMHALLYCMKSFENYAIVFAIGCLRLKPPPVKRAWSVRCAWIAGAPAWARALSRSL